MFSVLVVIQHSTRYQSSTFVHPQPIGIKPGITYNVYKSIHLIETSILHRTQNTLLRSLRVWLYPFRENWTPSSATDYTPIIAFLLLRLVRAFVTIIHRKWYKLWLDFIILWKATIAHEFYTYVLYIDGFVWDGFSLATKEMHGIFT